MRMSLKCKPDWEDTKTRLTAWDGARCRSRRLGQDRRPRHAGKPGRHIPPHPMKYAPTARVVRPKSQTVIAGSIMDRNDSVWPRRSAKRHDNATECISSMCLFAFLACGMLFSRDDFARRVTQASSLWRRNRQDACFTLWLRLLRTTPFVAMPDAVIGLG